MKVYVFLSIFISTFIAVPVFAEDDQAKKEKIVKEVKAKAEALAKDITQNGPNVMFYDLYMKNELHKIDYKNNELIKNRFYGKKGVPHSLVIYSDYACSHCEAAIKELKSRVDENKGLVNLYYVIFPLDKACNPGVTGRYSNYSCYAAKVALCAEKDDKFWEASALLYANRPANHEAKEFNIHNEIAKNLEIPDLGDCIKSKWVEERLAQEATIHSTVKIPGTPIILLDNRKIGNIFKEAPAFSSFLIYLDQKNKKNSKKKKDK